MTTTLPAVRAVAHGHDVQFYQDPRSHAQRVVSWLREGLVEGGAAIVIALGADRANLEDKLRDEVSAEAFDRCVFFDAEAVVHEVCCDGWPDEERFRARFVPILAEAARRGEGRVHVYGEAVTLFCRDGKAGAAVALEQMWNRIETPFQMRILCGYPLGVVDAPDAFAAVCDEHGTVMPVEPVDGRRLADLERRAMLLEHEVRARRSAEQALLARDLQLERHRALLERHVEERTGELLAANAELESFSASVSHDLRNHVTLVVGFAGLLRSRYGDALPAPARRLLDQVVVEAGRMGDVVEALLRLSRLPTGPLERAPTDLSRIAHEVLTQLPARQRRHVQADVMEGLEADADPHLVRILLENLLDNACKFSVGAAEPRIEVGRSDVGGRHFFVRDNGAGFDAAHATRVFRPFERLHGSDFPGTGIGLATVERIVRRHGGRVWAESAPGDGATFRFTLWPDP